jgi:thermitase
MTWPYFCTLTGLVPPGKTANGRTPSGSPSQSVEITTPGDAGPSRERVSPCDGSVSLVHTHEIAERHPALQHHDPGGPAECLVHRGQLLVPRGGLGEAVEALDRWIDHVDAADHATLRLRPTADAIQIAADYADRLKVSANHVHAVMVGAPILHGTGAKPEPVEMPPEPAVESWAKPVTVLILDTGVDPHPWFTTRPWFGEWGPVPETLDLEGDGVTDAQAGHGTFVTGVALRHAPGATLRHHRVLSSHGLTDDRTVAMALRRTRQHAAARGEHIDVIVLTAGCHTPDDRCPPSPAHEFSRFTDTVVVAAAGNHGTSRPFWPAALPSVTAVGATTPDGDLAPFSGRGPWLDTAAPGVDVVSAHVRQSEVGRTYGAARWSGTSFAAPRVAAEIATAINEGLTHTAARDRVSTLTSAR